MKKYLVGFKELWRALNDPRFNDGKPLHKELLKTIKALGKFPSSLLKQYKVNREKRNREFEEARIDWLRVLTEEEIQDLIGCMEQVLYLPVTKSMDINGMTLTGMDYANGTFDIYVTYNSFKREFADKSELEKKDAIRKSICTYYCKNKRYMLADGSTRPVEIPNSDIAFVSFNNKEGNRFFRVRIPISAKGSRMVRAMYR